MYDTILTVTGSLRFGIDSHRLTSEKKYLMRWGSRLCVSNTGSIYLCLRGTDEASLRWRFIVLDFMVVLSVVLPCSRFKA